jgi:hypothetical protein
MAEPPPGRDVHRHWPRRLDSATKTGGSGCLRIRHSTSSSLSKQPPVKIPDSVCVDIGPFRPTNWLCHSDSMLLTLAANDNDVALLLGTLISSNRDDQIVSTKTCFGDDNTHVDVKRSESQPKAIPLRLIEWCCTNYGKGQDARVSQHVDAGFVEDVTIDIHLAYCKELKSLNRKQFDVFRRRQNKDSGAVVLFHDTMKLQSMAGHGAKRLYSRASWQACVDYAVSYGVDHTLCTSHTTVGQVTFFRWANRIKLIDYCRGNIRAIEDHRRKHQGDASRTSARKRAGKCGGKNLKRRTELTPRRHVICRVTARKCQSRLSTASNCGDSITTTKFVYRKEHRGATASSSLLSSSLPARCAADVDQLGGMSSHKDDRAATRLD